MIKLVMFDVDGVLVDSEHLHRKALISALSIYNCRYTVNEDMMLGTIPTKEKLKWLVSNNRLTESDALSVYELKNENIDVLIKTEICINNNITHIFGQLKKRGISIGLVSNARSSYIDKIVKHLCIEELVDFTLSSSDHEHKPSPAMYLKGMYDSNVSPFETIIVEDSVQGKTASYLSGANTYSVSNYKSLSTTFLEFVESHNETISVPYINSELYVLIPMAGNGSRFSENGYTVPKPLIDINGKPMVQCVIENLNIIPKNYIFIVQQSHIDKYRVDVMLRSIHRNCIIIPITETTEGAACSVLLANEYINGDDSLLIVNSDNLIKWDNTILDDVIQSDADGSILCFVDDTRNPKWSFAKECDGAVIEVAEKDPISNLATSGHYFWRHGKDYMKYASQMIQNNTRVNGEFYVTPVYNEAIADNKKITTAIVDEMWGVGTPEDLEYYLKYGNIT